MNFVSFCQNWYCLSKTLAEREALGYAEKTGLDVVTVCPSLVFGPLLQPTVNTSSLFLIRYLQCKPASFRCRIDADMSHMTRELPCNSNIRFD
jgi:nucleoside-diphosphate-sugar epimerase